MPDFQPHDEPTPPDPEAESGSKTLELVVRTADLFGDHREIWIEHAGERYRLRITRRNKLILQK